MTPDRIASLVKAGLTPYAVPKKGSVVVARDPFDVLELLLAGPRGMALVVHYAGGEAAGGDFGEAESVNEETDELIEVVVGTAMGPEATNELRLLKDSGSRPGLLQRVAEVRAKVLAFVFPDEETTLRRFKYRGCESVTTPEGYALAAYRLRFALRCVIEIEADEEIVLEEEI